MKQTHIIVKPEDVAPSFPALTARWMHGHSIIPKDERNPIVLAVWAKPSKAERRLYSGAMEHIG